MTRTAALWLLVGAIGYCLLPWHMADGGFWSFGWVTGIFSSENASALAQVLGQGRLYLAAPLIAFREPLKIPQNPA